MISFNFKRNVLKSVMFCGLLMCASSLSATTSHAILMEEETQPTDEVIATGYDRQANVNCILYKSGYLEVYSSGGNSYLSSIGFMIGSDKKDLIKTVYIKEIRTIQDDAFADCKNLTSVTFYPNDYKPVRKISGNAFRNCVSLKSITIPASVHEIERRVFEGCTSLESIVVEEGNSTYDSRDNCNAVIETATNTLKIGLSSTKIPNTVTTIGGGAFEGTTLKSIVIPEGVTLIENEAFKDCKSLEAVSLPNSLERIYPFAFRNSNISSISIPAGVKYISEDVFDGCNNLSTITVSNGNTKYDSRDNCNALIETATNTILRGSSSTVIPNTVTSIGSNAFRGTTLKSIVIPEGVTLIGNRAFGECKSLETVSLPNSLERIGYLAFYDSNISSISIPAGVKDISEDVFNGCENLSTITVSNGNTKYDSRDNCNALIETATNTILQGSSSTVIPNSVTAIGAKAFQGSKIAKIVIPNSVTAIGEYAFQGSNIAEVVIPNSVTAIEAYTFQGSKIAKVVIPESVKKIGLFAFQGCKSLTTIVCKSKSVIDVSRLIPFSPLPNATLYVPAESVEAYKVANGWRDFSNIQPLPYAYIDITAAGKTTYCSSNSLDFTNVEGVKAYLALGFSPSTGVVFLTRVNKIPAGVGFMIFGKEGQYEVPFCETDITYANLMVGTKSETTVASTADGKTNYVLANGADGVMFYLANDAVVPANKAYLSIPSSVINTPAKVIRLGFEDDMTTGILRVEDMTNKTDNKVYGLDGRRKASLSSGFNIVNGKKIYVK